MTQVEATEIITPKQNLNNVSVYASNNEAGLSIDLSFDKSNKVYKNAIDGKYSYTADAPIKFGMVYAASDSNLLNNITAQTQGAVDVMFTENLETYEKLYFNKKIENISAENLDKFYEIRPYVLIGSQYIYGDSRSYSPAKLANNIYNISDEKTKENLNKVFKDSTVFKGEDKNSLTFTLFSDFHYKQDMYIGSIEDLRTILKRADTSGSSFIMSAGDFCNDFAGSPELTNTYLNYKKADGTTLTAYNIYGNHELEASGNSMDTVTPTLTNNTDVIWGTKDGSFDSNIGYYYFEENGFRIVCIDTNYSKNSSGVWEHNEADSHGPPSGNTSSNSLGDVQLAWLENVLTEAANNGTPCIVVGHAGFSGKFATSSADAATVRAIYARVNAVKADTVVMSINGHEHTNNQGYVDGVFYFDTNTVFNGRWVEMNGSSYHYNDLTYRYENYDDKGNLIEVKDRKITDLYQGRNTWFFEDPLSAVITVDEFGTITVDGMETTWKHNVFPTDLPAGKMPCITSGTFWDGESLSHVWSEEWDSNDTHHWHTCANGSCTATDISLNYGYETHTFEEKDGKKVCVCGAVEKSSDEETVNVWDGSIADSFSGGSGTASDPYLIETPDQLAYLVNHDIVTVDGASKNKYYKLTADIYLNNIYNANWKNEKPNSWFSTESSKRFKGHLDGDGHTIYGLYTNTASSIGLFAFADAYHNDVSIKNLTISNSEITTTASYAGAFIGFAYSSVNSNTLLFESCYVTDSVAISTPSGSGTTGGFVGFAQQNKNIIKNSASIATLTGKTKGGFTGGFANSSGASAEEFICCMFNFRLRYQ